MEIVKSKKAKQNKDQIRVILLLYKKKAIMAFYQPSKLS